MLAPRKRPVHLLVTIVFFSFLVFFYRKAARSIYFAQFPAFHRYKSIAENDPANATLGFGAIVVVSKDGSTRRPPLVQAANVTDILLTIPSQPQWTEEDVKKFNSSEESESGPTIGSIYAWLGHHNALRWFLNSGLETALILEDDVDFDIQLRSLQIPLAAHAARSKIPPGPSNHTTTTTQRRLQNYWGDPTQWDLLYLGHCGDYFAPISAGRGPHPLPRPSDLLARPHALYPDPTLPAPPNLHPYTAALLAAFDLPKHTRAFHRSKFPLCTFAYAVTRPTARRLLRDLAPARNPSPLRHFAKAFDVAVLKACRAGEGLASPAPGAAEGAAGSSSSSGSGDGDGDGNGGGNGEEKKSGPGLRCWTVNPELFHHMPGESQIAQMAAAVEHYVGIPPVDAEGAEQVRRRNETINIRCGFWGGAFGFREGDGRRLAFLREEVGRKGRCLKGGREAGERWTS